MMRSGDDWFHMVLLGVLMLSCVSRFIMLCWL